MITRTKLVGTGSAVLLAGTLGLVPAAAANAATHSSQASQAVSRNQPAATSLPVTGTLAGSTFTGAISNLTAFVQNGVLMVRGTITGTGLPAGGTTFTAPVQSIDPPSCDVLTLDLGPLHLDLLGLVVDLAPVHLDVTAVPGAGNLLGNLVCAITHLLDQNGGLSGIAALLNRLLTGLGL